MDGNIIDIILCCYNSNFTFLERSVDSVLSQGCSCWNLYIINDGSKNNLYDFLKERYLDNLKIYYYENEQNIGLPASLNVGHSLGESNFICWTSDDNYYSPAFVEKMLRLAKENNFEFIRSLETHVDIKGKVVEIFDPRRGTSELNKNSILYDGYLGASHLYTRELYNKTTGYTEELAGIEDLDMYYQFMEITTKIGFVKESLYTYTVDTSSFARNKVEEARRRFIKKWLK